MVMPDGCGAGSTASQILSSKSYDGAQAKLTSDRGSLVNA